MAELLNCPFCGGWAETRHEGREYFVACGEPEECGAEGHRALDEGYAIECWNRRSGVEGREAVIEECAKVADDHATTWGTAMGSPARVIASAIRALSPNKEDEDARA